MTYESMDRTTGQTRGRNVVDAAQDAAERAGSYVQTQMGRVSDRAQDLGRAASDRVEEYTGRSAEAWASQLRDQVRAHPLRMLAITIGVGYVLGKLMTRD